MRELLNGVYDLHIHTSPDVAPRKYSDLELARRLAERGMAGCAIKCHYFDTAARAGLLMAQFPQLDVAGGVTLNRSVGGLNPDAVERSAQAGGRMVWFPTLEAQSYQRYQHRNDPEADLSRFLTVCDEEGKLLPQALEVLDIAARHHMVVGTGHVGAEEGMALVRAAAERNCTIVLTHADNPADCYSVEQQEEAAALGAYVEHGGVCPAAPGPGLLPGGAGDHDVPGAPASAPPHRAGLKPQAHSRIGQLCKTVPSTS